MPTIRQRKAVENLVGNGGNVTKAMREANYAEATINTPQKLTESKGFQELWEEVIPDTLLTEVHKEGLQAYKTDKITLKIGGEEQISISNDPDFATRHKYLDTAYKLKGSYAPEKSVNLNLSVSTEKQKVAAEAITRFLNGNK